jgi:hypothetical protein
MRQIFAVLFILFFLSTNAQTLPVESTTAQTQPLLISQNQYAQEVNAAQYPAVPQSPAQKELKLVIVTLDGYRWQEQFGGVSKMLQKRLFKDPKFDKAFASKITARYTRRKAKNIDAFYVVYCN